MEFDELPHFTKRVVGLLADEDYIELQVLLMSRPEVGKIIKKSGGLRKVRWAAEGRGKRGGLRVIYYWWVSATKITFCDIYPKNEKEDLTTEQIKIIRQGLGT